MNNKINYLIIFLCILCIILVSVYSTGSQIADWFLGILSVISASSVYLIRKNEREEELQIEEEKRQIKQRKQKEEDERQNQIDNIKRQIDEIKKEEEKEADLFKQTDKIFMETLSLEDQEKLKDERIQIQQKILQIIEEYKNEMDNSKSKPTTYDLEDLNKISVRIINSIVDTNPGFTNDFFTNYKYGYLKPIKTLNNTDINVIISNIDKYNKMSELGKFNYRNQYNLTITKDHDYSSAERSRFD